LVSIDFGRASTGTPGIWVAEFAVFRDSDHVYSQAAYLEIVGSVFHSGGPGPISMAQVRLAMRDVCPEANYLIDEVEFSDEEIGFCIHRVIDWWNETPPPTGTYTYQNFPYRHLWFLGTIACLLRIGALWYHRNRANVQITGGLIDDRNKGLIYQQLGDARWKEFTEAAGSLKVTENMRQGFNRLSSPYAYRW